MTNLELKKIALKMVEKGYTDHETVRYSDDLYSATEEEIDKCLAFLDDILENGMSVFRANIDN